MATVGQLSLTVPAFKTMYDCLQLKITAQSSESDIAFKKQSCQKKGSLKWREIHSQVSPKSSFLRVFNEQPIPPIYRMPNGILGKMLQKLYSDKAL